MEVEHGINHRALLFVTPESYMDAKLSESLIVDAVYKNSSRPLSPSLSATGLRTNDLKFRALGVFPQLRTAEEFLLNSRFVRDDSETILSIQEYFRDSSMVMLSEADNALASPSAIQIPQSPEITMSLKNALKGRRSTRIFTGDVSSLDTVAALLRCGSGKSGQVEYELTEGCHCELNLRTAASAGGLYPVDCLLVALKVDGLDRGVYGYNPGEDCLDPHYAITDAVLASVSVPDNVIAISQASCLIILVARFWKSMRKYGPRGIRFIFQEAGAISQNIHLTAVALGLGTTDNASFYDDELDEALGFDGLHSSAIHMIVVGSPS